jgi:alkylation response protein AidB-like acyl-CoA dehydrogenase
VASIRFTKEQAMLADIAGKFFRERWPMEAVRARLGSDEGFDAALWREMADLGWLGIAVPEEHGGAGLGPSELVPLVEPMGRALFASPFVSTQLAIQVLRSGGSPQQQHHWLPRLAAGEAAAVAVVEADGDWALERCSSVAEGSGSEVELRGEKAFVEEAPQVALFVVTVSWRNEPAVVLLDAEQLPARAVEREVVIDETRRSYRLSLEGIEVEASALVGGDAARRALRALRDTALLLVAAEACGGAAGTLALIVDYLNSRRQFGRLIGSFQALKHPTVDVLVGLERARSHLYHAATVFGGEEAETALRMAKAEASDAFAFAGDRAIQFHGALGFTWECDAQLFLRRALWCQYQYGDATHHRKRLADLLLSA